MSIITYRLIYNIHIFVGDGNNDHEIAKATWALHAKREDSIIRDLMGSLMRSQLTCPDCKKVSVSYEYHSTHQVSMMMIVIEMRIINDSDSDDDDDGGDDDDDDDDDNVHDDDGDDYLSLPRMTALYHISYQLMIIIIMINTY